MTLDADRPRPRQRGANVEANTLRRAREVAAPFQEQIGPWQQRLAFLRTTKAFRSEHDIRSEAAELLPLVTAARIELDAALIELDDDAVARHSLTASLRASLERLRDDLDDLHSA